MTKLGDFKAASAVRLAILRAPWSPMTRMVAIYVFDLQGLARGRCEKGVGAIAKELDVHIVSVKQAFRELRSAGVLDLEDNGRGKRSFRRLRTTAIVEQWGVKPTGSEATTGSQAATGGVVRRLPGGESGGYRGGSQAATGIQEDLLEDPLEDPLEAAAAREAPVQIDPPKPIASTKPSASTPASTAGPLPVVVADLESAQRRFVQLVGEAWARLRARQPAPAEREPLEKAATWLWDTVGADASAFEARAGAMVAAWSAEPFVRDKLHRPGRNIHDRIELLFEQTSPTASSRRSGGRSAEPPAWDRDAVSPTLIDFKARVAAANTKRRRAGGTTDA